MKRKGEELMVTLKIDGQTVTVNSITIQCRRRLRLPNPYPYPLLSERCQPSRKPPGAVVEIGGRLQAACVFPQVSEGLEVKTTTPPGTGVKADHGGADGCLTTLKIV